MFNYRLEDSNETVASKLVQYSSFRLTKANHRVKTDGTLELKMNTSEVRCPASNLSNTAVNTLQRFLVLGSFGIRVLAGEVTVSGATLWPGDQPHWIHATHCHAVPVLRTAERTRLEIQSDINAKGLRQLERLSPLFRRIWNEPQNADTMGMSGHDPTYTIVRSIKDNIPT